MPMIWMQIHHERLQITYFLCFYEDAGELSVGLESFHLQGNEIGAARDFTDHYSPKSNL